MKTSEDYSYLSENAESRREPEEIREERGMSRLAALTVVCFALAATVWKWWPK